MEFLRPLARRRPHNLLLNCFEKLAGNFSQPALLLGMIRYLKMYRRSGWDILRPLFLKKQTENYVFGTWEVIYQKP
jgi:hypothetical protein